MKLPEIAEASGEAPVVVADTANTGVIDEASGRILISAAVTERIAETLLARGASSVFVAVTAQDAKMTEASEPPMYAIPFAVMVQAAEMPELRATISILAAVTDTDNEIKQAMIVCSEFPAVMTTEEEIAEVIGRAMLSDAEMADVAEILTARATTSVVVPVTAALAVIGQTSGRPMLSAAKTATLKLIDDASSADLVFVAVSTKVDVIALEIATDSIFAATTAQDAITALDSKVDAASPAETVTVAVIPEAIARVKVLAAVIETDVEIALAMAIDSLLAAATVNVQETALAMPMMLELLAFATTTQEADMGAASGRAMLSTAVTAEVAEIGLARATEAVIETPPISEAICAAVRT